jgi:amino acid transporter
VNDSKSSSVPLVLPQEGAPKPALSLIDAIGLVVGVVIGAGIFETPALVASNLGNDFTIILFWILGGVISFIGALCFAELATAYPHVGGNYHYLHRTYGRSIAFLFAWARMTVVQTGSIALLAFVFGDYASQILPLGSYSASIYAGFAIAGLTAINLVGLQPGKWTQNWLSIAKILGLVLVIVVGLAIATPGTPAVAEPSTPSWGMAMIFVLLSYGGWNEAAYISAEIRNPQRNMARSLLFSIAIISAIYVAINLAYLHGLSITGMVKSEAVAADLMRGAVGQSGAVFISVLIAITTLSALNATIFTGARTNYALGKDFSLFRFLGHWQEHSNTPAQALMLQSAIALLLIILGSITRKGFETMVDYTAPVFWFFFLLVGIALILLRIREPNRARPFRVPLYPITPLLFCATCAYLLYSSLVYMEKGAIVGVIVVALGIPMLYWQQQLTKSARQRETT